MKKLLSKLTGPLLFALVAMALFSATPVMADEEAGPVDEYLELVEASGAEYAPAFDFFTVSMLWTVIAAALVFIMHLGFATLEAGLTQAKNTVNILFKNVWIISIGLITYAVLGFNTHYPGAWQIENWVGIGGMIGDLNADGGDTWGYGGLSLAMTAYGDFIFQAMFAATAATIVSGAVAERVKLSSFMIYSTILVAFGYTIAGSWHWGGGWLANLGGGDAAFYDFAGSTVVHVSEGRHDQANPRPQHATRSSWRIPPFLRMVRIQWRLGSFCESWSSWSRIHDYGLGSSCGRDRFDSRLLGSSQETRSLHGAQRLARWFG
jgi:Amt family ammonium transporter